MKRSVLIGLVLVGTLVGTANRAAAELSGIPQSLATIWIDDLGNGFNVSRSWTDWNGDYVPGCTLLSATAQPQPAECGAASATLPLPSLPFRVGPDPGAGGSSLVLKYVLPNAIPGTAGDVVIDGTLGSAPSLLVRFNGDGTAVVYSYVGAQPPVPLNANTRTLAGLNPFTSYIPLEGDPGFGYALNSGNLTNYLVYVFRRPTTVLTDTRYLPLSGGSLTGSLTATAFSGAGGGLTGLSPGSLSAGTAGIDITGNAATATNAVTATSAVNAASALNAANAALLGGVAPANFARRDVANAFAGAQAVNGSLAIGGGAAITQHLSAAYNIALPSIKPSKCLDLPQVLNGAVAGANDTIALGIPNTLLSAGGFLMFQVWESGANAITIRACNVNPAGPASSAASGVVRVDMWKH